MPADVSDAPLWQRARSGDGQAFAALFDRHARRVHRYAWRIVEHTQDAEDVTGAVFLELWRRRRDVRVVDGSIVPWLLVTTTNVARNATRTIRRHRRLLARIPTDDRAPDVADRVEELEHSAAARATLMRALRELGDADAALVALVLVEERPIAEAADALGLTYSAAKSRLHRARGRLRDAVGGLPAGLALEVEPPSGSRPDADPSTVVGGVRS